jgi:hypothetical protein
MTLPSNELNSMTRSLSHSVIMSSAVARAHTPSPAIYDNAIAIGFMALFLSWSESNSCPGLWYRDVRRRFKKSHVGQAKREVRADLSPDQSSSPS